MLKVVNKLHAGAGTARSEARRRPRPAAESESANWELRALVDELIGLAELDGQPFRDLESQSTIKRQHEPDSSPHTAAPLLRRRCAAASAPSPLPLSAPAPPQPQTTPLSSSWSDGESSVWNAGHDAGYAAGHAAGLKHAHAWQADCEAEEREEAEEACRHLPRQALEKQNVALRGAIDLIQRHAIRLVACWTHAIHYVRMLAGAKHARALEAFEYAPPDLDRSQSYFDMDPDELCEHSAAFKAQEDHIFLANTLF